MILQNQNNNRIIIENTFSSLKIIVPSNKLYILIIYGLLLFTFWLFGLVVILLALIKSNIIKTQTTPMILWIISWSLIGIYLMNLLYWQFWGKEIILITRESIEISKISLFHINNKKEYLLSKIENLRITPPISSKFGLNFSYGIISFDYKSKIISFLISNEESEAIYIINEIKYFLKSEYV
jgi:hypothetical protein